MFGKRSVTFLLILSIVSSTFYLPVFTPRAQAFIGFNFVIDVKAEIKRILNAVGMAIAQRMINDIVRSTVDWAQSGFQGNPAYVTDPRQYFTDMTDRAVGGFIAGSDLNYLCSPFQTQIRLALRSSYARQPFQCTLTRVVGNIEAFYSDFSQGGWGGWFSMTQNSSNNPYGAYLDAQIELDRRIAEQISLEKNKLDWNQGFLSFEKCRYEWTQSDVDYARNNPNYAGEIPEVGGCPSFDKETVTPGTTIKSQLDKVLPAGLERLISATEIEQLIGAFLSGILNRYVFSSKGLFNKNASAAGSSREIIDIDGDKVTDGWDYDGDGQLDVCHHGSVDGTLPPSNTNCVGSTQVASSPYFVPICQALTNAIRVLTRYLQFINDNPFQNIYYNTWTNRTIDASGAVNNLEGVIARYEDMRYDPSLFFISKYIEYLDKIIESLAKDEDIEDFFGDDEDKRQELIRNTGGVINYLTAFRIELGQCDNPNANAIAALPVPTIEDNYSDPNLGGGGTGGITCTTCAQKGQTDLYQGDVTSAANAYLAANPQLANLSSVTDLNAVAQLRDGTIAILIGQGFNSEKEPSPDPYANGEYFYPQVVNVWRNGDPDMISYRVTAGGGSISAAIGAGYCSGHSTLAGDDIIPNMCLSGGGTGGGTGGGGTGTTGTPAITSVSPTSVVAGQTTVAIFGSNLTSTVQFFDSTGARYTVTGSVNSSRTQVTVQVPAGMAIGSGSVVVYQSATSISNSVPIQITGSVAATPSITSVSPTTVVSGSTTMTINGSNLTSTVQFFDSTGARYTVTGSVNSSGTQITVLVPSGMPLGAGSVRVYANTTTISNSVPIQVSTQSVSTITAYDAVSGSRGGLAYNPTNNNWLVVGALNTIAGRIMANDGSAVTPEFAVNTTSGVQVMFPKVAFAPSLNKYLVVWIGFPTSSGGTIYGRFVNADGTFSGAPFTIYTDSGGASFFNPNSILQYDSVNNRFVFVWEFRNPDPSINLITISGSGVVGGVVQVATGGGIRRWSPSLAINTAGTEYCIAYDERDLSRVVTRSYNPSSGLLGTETILNNLGTDTSIVYSSVNNRYMVGWSASPTIGSQARILNSCNIQNVNGTTFTSNGSGQTQILSYNPNSNAYASIVQDRIGFGNSYIIMNSTGVRLRSGVAFTGGTGNFAPVISANTNDGLFSAISSRDYVITRFAPGL